MRKEDRAQAEAAIRDAVTAAGFEVLRLTISNAHHVVAMIDLDPGPIDLDHCTRVNFCIRDAIRAAGFEPDNWSVEVESPGITRPLQTLRHFERYIGERARIKLKAALSDGQKVIQAEIGDVANGKIRLLRGKAGALELTVQDIFEATLEPEAHR